MFGSFTSTGLAGKAWHGYSALRRLQLEATRFLQRPSLYNQHATPLPLLSAQRTLQYIHPPHTRFSFYCPSLSSTFLGKKERTDSLQIFLCLSHGSHFLSYRSRFAEHPCDLVVVDTMESFKDPLKRPCWFPCFLVYGCWFRKPNLSTVESHLIPPLLPWYLPRSFCSGWAKVAFMMVKNARPFNPRPFPFQACTGILQDMTGSQGKTRQSVLAC